MDFVLENGRNYTAIGGGSMVNINGCQGQHVNETLRSTKFIVLEGKERGKSA